MLVISDTRAVQLEMDLDTDRHRLARLEWQRALECDLHAVSDYVRPDALLMWQPGSMKRGPIKKGTPEGFHAFSVQLTTLTSCTCQRFRLKDRCEHVAFAVELNARGILPAQDVAVRAVSIEGNEVAA